MIRYVVLAARSHVYLPHSKLSLTLCCPYAFFRGEYEGYANCRKTSPGTHNASGTSEQRRGDDVTQNTKQEYEGTSYVGTKTGSESLIDSVEKSVHEGGEATHSGEDVGQVSAGR